MKHLCTLSDINYLGRGLALYESLKVTCQSEFQLYYLCLDQASFDKLSAINLPQLVPHLLANLENNDSNLQVARNNRPYNEYCWTLASYYSQYLLPEYPHITYLDSNLYFYADIDIIYKEIGEKSVGIIAHRHNSVGDRDGAYNVGVVYFRNNKIGRETLNWWADAVLHKKYPELQTCGDQKYLEEFIPRFGEENICVANKTFGHGAPWNFRLYTYDQYDKTGMIGWGGTVQPLVFNHFSRFSYDVNTGSIDFTSGKFMDHTLNGAIFNIPQVYKFYVQYYTALKTVHKNYLL